MGKWERECLVLLWEGRRHGFDEVKQEERGEEKGPFFWIWREGILKLERVKEIWREKEESSWRKP